MNLEAYFESTEGMGVLSTADGEGKVNSAVYARPHILDDGIIAFIMRDRLTRHNLKANPHAAYLFREKGSGYNGVRLHLTKTHEESDTALARELCRRCRMEDSTNAVRYLVIFKIDKEMPLIGPGDSA